jgi:hypothetical protein
MGRSRALSKLKSVDFYRKIPADLTESSLTGAALSITAAFSIVLLLLMVRGLWRACVTGCACRPGHCF